MPKKFGETKFYETSFGIIPRSKLIPLEVEGIKKAWDFLLQAKNKEKIIFSSDFIKKLHKIGFAWIFPEDGGQYRKEEVIVSKHIPPKYYLVPQMVEGLLSDITVRIKNLPLIEEKNYIDKLIELLAWSHHRFLWIHPFKDYNGRIGRLFVNMILFDLNLPPIELKIETEVTRKNYVKALQKADQGDYQALETIIKKTLLEK